ncbi:MAG: hypothetical protein SFY96_02340 [Planctomycetota bacterium]|nr:hypothetical protein [Planctomycetota bacterium]
MSSSTDQPGSSAPKAQPTVRPGTTGDDVMGVLSEFEQGLESLKKLYGERKALLAALEDRENELSRREVDIARREQDAQARQTQAEQLQQQVGELARTLQDRENTLREQRELLERTQAEAKRRAEELEALDRAIAERAAAQTAEAQKTASELDAKLGELKRVGSDLAAQRQQAEQDRAALAAMMEELPRREASLKSQIAEHTRAMESDRRALDAARAELAKAEESLQSERAALNDARTQAESREIARLTDALHKAEAAAGEMGRRAEQAATQAEAASARVASLEEQIKALQASTHQQQSAAGALLSEIKTKADQATAALQTQLAQAQRERDEAASRAAQAEQRAAAAEAATQTKTKELSDALAKATQTAELSAAARTIEERELRAQIEQTSKDLAQLEQILDQLRDRLKAEAARADDATKRVSELEAIMSSPAGADSALRIECDRLQEELAQARAQLATQPKAVHVPSGANAADSAWVAHRRARLSRGRRLLIEQTKKIRRAGEVLHKRFEQCEQILAQRAELAAAKRVIDQTSRTLASREAKAKSGSLVLISVFTIAVLGVLSWFAAGQFFPGEFASRATIAAESKGRELSPDELHEWQTFHQSLIDDPRFSELAADRMNQKGITTLGQPGAIQALVRSKLSTSSKADGQLTLELRGDGPERTQRVLDTFAVSLASQANAVRDRRVDGGVTVVKETASLPVEPLDNQRVAYAGIFWAASSLLAFIVGLVLWKQLAAAKARFEQSNRVDALLDESHWPTLEN